MNTPVLYFPTAENKIIATHISISITNRAKKKITSNSYLEYEHRSVIKDWRNHSEQKNHSAAHLLHF